jgi:acetylornithine deacetylase/succinyl-diaminopimelate desuccinylase-like protein
VNSIPESATASVDYRSTGSGQLDRLEAALRGAVEEAVSRRNDESDSTSARSRGRLTYNIDRIGDRPAAELAVTSPLAEALQAVDRHLGIRTDFQLGSTDANLPLSLGIQALSLGAGGEGGNAHTRAEWYSAKGRDIGLKRVLLLTLAMADWTSAQAGTDQRLCRDH